MENSMHFKNCFVAVLLSVALFSKIDAYAVDDFPKTLLGLLKPGVRLAVTFADKDSYVTLAIFDEETFNAVSDAEIMKLDELREKHPLVAKKIAEVLAIYATTLESKQADLKKGYELAEPRIEIAKKPWLLCTAKYVGEDYVLVAYEKNKQSKTLAFPKSLISRIYMNEGFPVVFYDNVVEK